MALSRTRWGIVVLLISAGVIGAFQVGKAAIAVPALREDLGLSLYSASWIVGALGLLGALVALPASLLLTLLPARATLIAGLGAVGAGSIAGAYTASGDTLLATRALEGCGFLCIILSAPRLFRLVTAPADNQSAFALWGCYMPVGAAVMMLMGPLFIQSFGWRGLWLFNGFLPIAYALVVALLPIPGSDARDSSRHDLGKNIRAGFATPGPLLVAVAFATYTFQYFALSSLFPALLVERLGLSIGAAGLISAGAVLANGVGNLLAGGLLRLGLPVWLIVATGFLASGTFAFGIFSDAVPVGTVAVLAAASLAITGLVPASLFAAAPLVSSTAALLAVTLGLITQIGIAGQFLGPAALAAFVERYDWSQAPVIFVAAMVLGIGLSLALRRVLRKPA
ncbi:MAG TPA: MFS transporter [Xanthobacteraceae bacterium]|jgi:MFS family permease